MLSVTEGRLNVEKYFCMKNIPDDVIVLPAVRGVINHPRTSVLIIYIYNPKLSVRKTEIQFSVAREPKLIN